MIQAENLNYKYDHRGIAGIHSFSLKVKEGEVLGIIGPNGSGKTTLLKLLSSQILPHSGTIKIEGKISIFSENQFTSQINVQKFLLENMTLDIDDEKKILLIRDLADTFEFTFQLRQNLDELSSGQKQKVLLARVLLNSPQILFMDEPFSHLDPFTRGDILKSLFKYIRQQNITVIWITHDLDEVLKFSDQLALLNFGRMEQIAESEQFIQKPKNLFVAQFIGYRNFFHIKFHEEKWTSPWGMLHFPPLEKEDGILVVPDDAWTIDPDGIVFKVIDRYAGKQCIHYELESGPHKIFMTQGPELACQEVGSEMSLRPFIRSCFVIKL